MPARPTTELTACFGTVSITSAETATRALEPKSSSKAASAICSHGFHLLPTGADEAAPSNGNFSQLSIVSFGGRRFVAAAIRARAILARRPPEGLREDQGRALALVKRGQG